ncbi:MAG: hypothetical protein JST83_00845 [Bacteroidetes bacterium]|nr:hypothetical protein [Bacteroidota bacterium]
MNKIKEALEVLREFNTSEKATLDIQVDDHNVNCSIEGNTAGLVMIATAQRRVGSQVRTPF